MKRVYRYELHIADTTSIEIPVDAKILKFGARAQHPDVVEFWALVDDERKTEQKLFRVVGTGHDFPDVDEWRYLDSVITAKGALVWHIFRMETGDEFALRVGL